MSEWPEGWSRGEPGASGRNAGDADLGQTASVPSGQRAAPPGSWPEQPPVSSSGYAFGTPTRSPARSPAWSGGPGGPSLPRRRRWLRPGRIFGVLAILIALLLAGTAGVYFYLNGKLTHADVLAAYDGRPSPGVGTNWLITGSDSRQGLTAQQEHEYSTGQLDATGPGRSDTILILHIPAGGGRPVLISIPRDSYVNIPGYGMDKINAAYSFGGPALLAQTIQSDTGLYINHYMGIGFGGFVNVVNAVGGVTMCLPQAINDQASGLNLQAGCQVLSGGQALAYVRDRHTFVTQDLQREQDQRIFLSALLKKMTSTGVILNPFAAIPAASGAASNLTVDQGTSLYQLLTVARALRNPLTTTVPIANASYYTSAGDSVLWNAAEATQLFTALQDGQAVPPSLITGSTLGS
jgi:LCP family protein required for cell wall assembly